MSMMTEYQMSSGNLPKKMRIRKKLQRSNSNSRKFHLRKSRHDLKNLQIFYQLREKVLEGLVNNSCNKKKELIRSKSLGVKNKSVLDYQVLEHSFSVLLLEKRRMNEFVNFNVYRMLNE